MKYFQIATLFRKEVVYQINAHLLTNHYILIILGMICEPKYFASINTEQMLKKHTSCTSTDRKASFVAPAVNSQGNVCTLQDEKLMFSCTANSPTFSRLCPCRDFIKGQVALCNGCI